MWFLILQILPLLIIAALLGACLTYWWMNSRYEDVTESHEALLGSIRTDPDAPELATREHLDARLEALSSSLQLPPPDYSPLLEKIDLLERKVSDAQPPTPDFSPVIQRIEALEALHIKLDALQSNLSGLTDNVTGIENVDLTPIETRLDSLELGIRTIESKETPSVDLGPVHSGLATLGLSIDEVKSRSTDTESIKRTLDMLDKKLSIVADQLNTDRRSDTDQVLTKLNSLSNALANIKLPSSDLEPVQKRLETIETLFLELNIPETDLTPLSERLDRMDARFAGPNFSLEQVGARVENIESAISDLSNYIARQEPPKLGPIESRLARIEQLAERQDRARDVVSESVTSSITELTDTINAMPRPDTRSVTASLTNLERAVADIERQPSQDFGPLQNRFTALEARLDDLRSELRGLGALEAMEKRLSVLQQSIRDHSGADLSPVLNQLHLIDSRIDLGALENRLTAIEYGLTAVHQMLRTRQEYGYSHVENGWRERPQSPAPSASWRETGERRSERLGFTETTSTQAETRQTSSRPATRNTKAFVVKSEKSVLRDGDRANLLVEPAFGEPDDLEEIAGVGPMLNELLLEIGVYYFWQIAEWGEEEIAWVDSKLLHFRGRIKREAWVEQAKELMQLPNAAKRPE